MVHPVATFIPNNLSHRALNNFKKNQRMRSSPFLDMDWQDPLAPDSPSGSTYRSQAKVKLKLRSKSFLSIFFRNFAAQFF